MNRKKYIVLLFGVLGILMLLAVKSSRADEFWDEDDDSIPEIFEEDAWELEDTFDTAEYSFELIPDGVKITGCLMEEEPEKLSLPAEVSLEGNSLAVKEIGEAAFGGMTEVTEIEIPEGITLIEDYAFEGCLQLEKVSIPNSVSQLGEGIFSECEALTEINVGEQNGKFAFFNSCLYQDGNRLIWCPPAAEEVTLREETTNIAEGAFSGCQFLTTVTIPSGVTEIKKNAFEGCGVLDTIYFQQMNNFKLEQESFPDISYCTFYVKTEEIKTMIEASEAYSGEEVQVVVEKQYTLRYESDGGIVEEPKSTYWNTESFLLPQAYKDGYLFKGWSETPKDSGKYVSSYDVGTEGDRTLYAIWEEDTDCEDVTLLDRGEKDFLEQQEEPEQNYDKNSFRRDMLPLRKRIPSSKEEEKIEDSQELDSADSQYMEGREIVIPMEMASPKEYDMEKEDSQDKKEENRKESDRAQEIPAFIIIMFIVGMICIVLSLTGMGYLWWKGRRQNGQEELNNTEK